MLIYAVQTTVKKYILRKKSSIKFTWYFDGWFSNDYNQTKTHLTDLKRDLLGSWV